MTQMVKMPDEIGDANVRLFTPEYRTVSYAAGPLLFVEHVSGVQMESWRRLSLVSRVAHPAEGSPATAGGSEARRSGQPAEPG